MRASRQIEFCGSYTRDDRGHRFKLLWLKKFLTPDRSRGFAHKRRWQRASRATLKQWVSLLMSIVVIGFALWLASLAALHGREGLAAWIALGTFIGMILLFSLNERWITARRIAGLLKIGHCGCCLYSLEGLLPAKDGCRVCPECGAAWRLGPADGD